MNAPSRPPNAFARVKRPFRPLPAIPAPAIPDSKKKLPCPPYLLQDDPVKPFKLLEAHPLSLLCRFHNVKRVSLEEGVPPPFKFDVPILRDAVENPDALLPTHILAVYDQDIVPEPSPGSPLLSYTAAVPSGPPSLPATPLMVPVNADLWAHHFSSALSSNHVSVSSSPAPISTIDAMRRHSRTSSGASTSSYASSSPSPTPSRPRAILTLPVHVIRVPSAKSLPLLLLAVLRVLPRNCIAPALLPRAVLAELPASPAILTQHLLLWLYPTAKDPQEHAEDNLDGSQINRGISPRSRERSSTGRPPSSPLLSPNPSPGAGDSRHFSSTSMSSLISTSSGLSLSSPLSSGSTAHEEPVCALADAATAREPDLRLLALAQQNFGLWTNALALSVKDAGVVQLVELAWTVSAEARRLRFGDPLEDGGDGDYSGSLRRSRRSRSRTRLPSSRVPFYPVSSQPEDS